VKVGGVWVPDAALVSPPWTTAAEPVKVGDPASSWNAPAIIDQAAPVSSWSPDTVVDVDVVIPEANPADAQADGLPLPAHCSSFSVSENAPFNQFE
jgi:hypothetical protein